MIDKLGPQLRAVLEPPRRLDVTSNSGYVDFAAGSGRGPDTATVPVELVFPPAEVNRAEGWSRYRDRVANLVGPHQAWLRELAGRPTTIHYASNSIRLDVTRRQFLEISRVRGLPVVFAELDPPRRLTALDGVAADLDALPFQRRHPTLDGSGVGVAIVDSGVDTVHPNLRVVSSVETCGEDVAIPGLHGTHCAGIVASSDHTFAGIAPAVDLVNIKAIRADGVGDRDTIEKGLDAAADSGAQIVSLSFGMNHLPAWSLDGDGWVCPLGTCALCTGVRNLVIADDRVVVAAAGNNHLLAEVLRRQGYAGQVDTDLDCPGQAADAITVGSHYKSTFALAPRSSRGPTAAGLAKPDLLATGVNITSTTPVPRDAKGTPDLAAARSRLFGSLSGTSMATAVVAGAAALLVQQELVAGRPWTPSTIRAALLGLGATGSVAGPARLTLQNW